MAAYNTVSATQFIAVVRGNLGPANFWEDDEILQYINAALRTWNCLTGFWSGTKTLQTAPNHPYYALGSNLLFGARIELNGQVLDPVSVYEWDQQDPNWMNARGTPLEWAPVGLAIIALRPIPPAGGDVLTVYGISVTPILVNPTDKINIGREDFNALADYITHTLQVKSGGAEFRSSKTSQQAFLKAAVVRNEKLRSTTFYRRIMGLEQDKQLKRIRSILSAITPEQSSPVGPR
jgi:hypothetical protein